MVYFIDKCLPFGAAISCAIFQAFSDAIAYVVNFHTGKSPVNYLDDYFFTALLRALCNAQVQVFLDICKTINFPVNLEKTFWVLTQMTFLGFLLDTVSQTISAPHEKIVRGINMIFSIINKKNRKVTVHQMQKICGFLNVLGCAIIPGRAFTCRIYSAINPKLKLHHHLHLNGETLIDLAMWLQFLRHCRVIVPFSPTAGAKSWAVEAFSLCVFTLLLPKSPSGPPWNEGHRPKFVMRPVYLRSQFRNNMNTVSSLVLLIHLLQVLCTRYAGIAHHRVLQTSGRGWAGSKAVHGMECSGAHSLYWRSLSAGAAA